MSYKPIMAAPPPPTYKVKAPHSLKPEVLQEAYQKMVLNTIDWSAIEVRKNDLYKKILDVLGKMTPPMTLNPGKHMNHFDWPFSVDQFRVFTKALYELIPSIQELESVTGQKGLILEYLQQDPTTGIYRNMIRAYFVKSMEQDNQEWLDKRRSDYEKRKFVEQRTLVGDAALGVDNPGYQSSQSSGITTPVVQNLEEELRQAEGGLGEKMDLSGMNKRKTVEHDSTVAQTPSPKASRRDEPEKKVAFDEVRTVFKPGDLVHTLQGDQSDDRKHPNKGNEVSNQTNSAASSASSTEETQHPEKITQVNEFQSTKKPVDTETALKEFRFRQLQNKDKKYETDSEVQEQGSGRSYLSDKKGRDLAFDQHPVRVFKQRLHFPLGHTHTLELYDERQSSNFEAQMEARKDIIQQLESSIAIGMIRMEEESHMSGRDIGQSIAAGRYDDLFGLEKQLSAEHRHLEGMNRQIKNDLSQVIMGIVTSKGKPVDRDYMVEKAETAVRSFNFWKLASEDDMHKDRRRVQDYLAQKIKQIQDFRANQEEYLRKQKDQNKLKIKNISAEAEQRCKDLEDKVREAEAQVSEARENERRLRRRLQRTQKEPPLPEASPMWGHGRNQFEFENYFQRLLAEEEDDADRLRFEPPGRSLRRSEKDDEKGMGDLEKRIRALELKNQPEDKRWWKKWTVELKDPPKVQLNVVVDSGMNIGEFELKDNVERSDKFEEYLKKFLRLMRLKRVYGITELRNALTVYGGSLISNIDEDDLVIPRYSEWAFEGDDDVFDKLVKKIYHHLGPSESKGARMFKFDQLQYDRKKSVQDNLLQFRKIAKKAGLEGQEMDSQIQTKFHRTFDNRGLVKKAWRDDWDLDTFVKQARGQQMADETEALLRPKNKPKEEVEKVFQLQKQDRGQGQFQRRQETSDFAEMKTCWRCGRKHDLECPALREICYACNDIGHFSRFCPNRPPPPKPQKPSGDYKQKYQKYRQMAKDLTNEKKAYQGTWQSKGQKQKGKGKPNYQKQVRKTAEGDQFDPEEKISETESSSESDPDFSSSSESDGQDD